MLYPSYYDVDDWNQLFFRLYFPPQPFLSNGLVAYYPFDGNGIDASGNGNNGVELNMTFPDGMYPFNKAAQFNGTNAAIIVTNSGNMNLLPLSLAVWVKEKGATGGEVGIITKYVNSSDNGFGLIAIGDLYKFWYFSETARLNSAGSPSGQLFGSAISDGMWHHVVASVNSVGCQLFTDGSLVTSCGWSGNATSPTTSQNILIGLYPDELNNYSCCRFFGGSMHNARIYNRALSASEVQQLYAYESGPRVNLIRAIIPSFDNLTLNANYRLQGSVDLKTWYDQAMPFSATTTEMIFPWYYAINDWNQLFFRLQANP